MAGAEPELLDFFDSDPSRDDSIVNISTIANFLELSIQRFSNTDKMPHLDRKFAQ